MPADLDDLLTGAAADPTEPIDVDELWSDGRRRRRRRRTAAAAAGGLASVAVIAVAVAAVNLGGTATPEVAPLAPPADEGVEEPAAPEPDEQLPDAVEDEEADESPAAAEREAEEALAEAQREREERALEEQQRQQEAEEAEAAAAESTDAPTPDSAAVADPCAPHVGGEMRAFIDVVAPVQGQVVDGSVELVGCSSVYEATVRYRLLSGSTVLVDSFTTATAGGPEIGEFRETIPVNASGPLTLQVFWEDASDGSERDLVTIQFDAS